MPPTAALIMRGCSSMPRNSSTRFPNGSASAIQPTRHSSPNMIHASTTKGSRTSGSTSSSETK